MYLRLAKRMLLETDKRLLWKLAWNMGYKGWRSVQKHKRRLRQGQFFPPYLYISIINSCNLRCTGCWVDVSAKQQKIDVEAMNRMITTAKQVRELHSSVCWAANRSCTRSYLTSSKPTRTPISRYFTNGHFITPEVARATSASAEMSPP
jgi:sulfatase maturation enzyme AslB (radical SAM superfamily)